VNRDGLMRESERDMRKSGSVEVSLDRRIRQDLARETGDAKPEEVSVNPTEPAESVPVAANGIVPPVMFGPVMEPMPAIGPARVVTSTDSAKTKVMTKSGPFANHHPFAGPSIFWAAVGAAGGWVQQSPLRRPRLRGR